MIFLFKDEELSEFAAISDQNSDQILMHSLIQIWGRRLKFFGTLTIYIFPHTYELTVDRLLVTNCSLEHREGVIKPHTERVSNRHSRLQRDVKLAMIFHNMIFRN